MDSLAVKYRVCVLSCLSFLRLVSHCLSKSRDSPPDASQRSTMGLWRLYKFVGEHYLLKLEPDIERAHGKFGILSIRRTCIERGLPRCTIAEKPA